MAVDPSQIRSWIRTARERAGLTQEKAAQRAGVGLGVVTNSEHKGSMMAENFLTLVITYGAEDALVNQLREWRNGGGEDDTGQGVGPDSPVPHSPLDRLTDSSAAFAPIKTVETVVGKKKEKKPKPGKAKGR